MYQQALDHLRGGRHDEAVASFRGFVKQHPQHDLADNAQYWLGECFYDRKDYSTALREFRRVAEKFPQGNKVPDALLKVAFSYLALGSARPARETLAGDRPQLPAPPGRGAGQGQAGRAGRSHVSVTRARGFRGVTEGDAVMRASKGVGGTGAGRGVATLVGPAGAVAAAQIRLPEASTEEEVPLPDIAAIESGASARASVSFGRPTAPNRRRIRGPRPAGPGRPHPERRSNPGGVRRLSAPPADRPSAARASTASTNAPGGDHPTNRPGQTCPSSTWSRRATR